jgi:hypothetical protein
MMRIIVIVLLLINIAFFIWAFTIGSTNYVLPPRVQQGIPALILLPSKNSYAYQSKNSKMESSCYTLGPYGSLKTARLVAKSINDFGLATEIHKQKTMQTLNFLVYLQSFSSRAEAEKVVRDMQKNKISTHKIIETGPYKNAISLGSFEDLDKARRHSEYVRFLGYDAKYTARKKPKEVFWIDYDEPFGSNAPVFNWTKKIDSRARVQKIPRACDF